MHIKLKDVIEAKKKIEKNTVEDSKSTITYNPCN